MEQLITAGVNPKTAEADACHMEHTISIEAQVLLFLSKGKTVCPYSNGQIMRLGNTPDRIICYLSSLLYPAFYQSGRATAPDLADCIVGPSA